MLRFAKDKVLYITLESTQDCDVGIQMTQNKTEAPDMTVASVYSSQGEMGMQLIGNRRDSNADLAIEDHGGEE